MCDAFCKLLKITIVLEYYIAQKLFQKKNSHILKNK